jgi:hypothetical protein
MNPLMLLIDLVFSTLIKGFMMVLEIGKILNLKGTMESYVQADPCPLNIFSKFRVVAFKRMPHGFIPKFFSYLEDILEREFIINACNSSSIR